MRLSGWKKLKLKITEACIHTFDPQGQVTKDMKQNILKIYKCRIIIQFNNNSFIIIKFDHFYFIIQTPFSRPQERQLQLSRPPKWWLQTRKGSLVGRWTVDSHFRFRKTFFRRVFFFRRVSRDVSTASGSG